MAENEEIAELDIDVVAEHPIIPVTRFEDDGSVGVEWVGRCWAWPMGPEWKTPTTGGLPQAACGRRPRRCRRDTATLGTGRGGPSA